MMFIFSAQTLVVLHMQISFADCPPGCRKSCTDIDGRLGEVGVGGGEGGQRHAPSDIIFSWFDVFLMYLLSIY